MLVGGHESKTAWPSASRTEYGGELHARAAGLAEVVRQRIVRERPEPLALGAEAKAA